MTWSVGGEQQEWGRMQQGRHILLFIDVCFSFWGKLAKGGGGWCLCEFFCLLLWSIIMMMILVSNRNFIKLWYFFPHFGPFLYIIRTQEHTIFLAPAAFITIQNTASEITGEHYGCMYQYRYVHLVSKYIYFLFWFHVENTAYPKITNITF